MRFKKYKKIISAVLTAALLGVCMSGCVSEADYKRLERRVAMLEQEVGISEASADPSASPSATATSRPTEEPSDDEEDEDSDEFDSKSVSSDIKVVENDFVDENGDKYSFFTFENNSDYDVTASIVVTCTNEDGEELDESDKTVEGIPAGGMSYASFKVDNDTYTVKRTVSYEEYTDSPSPIEAIDYSPTETQGGASITVENNGTDTLKGVKYLALYYDGSALVGFDAGDVPNISPLSVETISSECGKDYESVEVYFALDD